MSRKPSKAVSFKKENDYNHRALNPGDFLLAQKYFLLLAFVFYGLFSSPTPDAVSWAEISIGFFLLCTVGIRKFSFVLSGSAVWQGTPREKFLTSCFLILLIPATLCGFLSGHEMNDVVRDIIPLGYLFLPLFLNLRTEKDRDFLLRGILFTGVFFALRFWPASGLTLGRFGLDRGNDELLYLTSSPSVLFSGLYLFFQATSLEKMRLRKRLFMAALSLACLLTIIATLQRAAIALSALVIFAMCWHRTQRSPHFLYAMLAMVFVAGLWLAPVVGDIVALIWRKTVEVGDNERFAELHSVIAAMGDNPWHFIFGMGWGAKVMTAASGFVDVRYTHMLASYALLKTGLVGFVALGAYIVWLIRKLLQKLPQQPMMICAALPSFILGVTLYPSFKMLCFGAILALLASEPEPRHDP